MFFKDPEVNRQVVVLILRCIIAGVLIGALVAHVQNLKQVESIKKSNYENKQITLKRV